MKKLKFDHERPFIVSVTGTKGKTTIVRIIDHVLRKVAKNVLLVDTDGFYLDGKRLGTLDTSNKLYGLYPTVCPGKHLYPLKNKKGSFAIFETSIGSAGVAGLGYDFHHIGIFTNVFEDHLGIRVQTREELAERKASILYPRVRKEGLALMNADDELTVKHIDLIREGKDIDIIYVTMGHSVVDLDRHVANGGKYLTYENGYIILVSPEGKERIINADKLSWTFEGKYEPSLYNLAFVVGALIKIFGKENLKKQKILKYLEEYKPHKRGGRLQLLESKKSDIKVIIDYAHEKYSINKIAGLARNLSKNKTIGVIRFDTKRTREQLEDYGRGVALAFDELIVYDKIDGEFHRPLKNKEHKYYWKKGEISQIIVDQVKSIKGDRGVQQVIREEDAFKKALEIAEAGDVIVHISNDHDRTLRYVKKHL